MVNSLGLLGFFLAIGIFWRFVNPNRVSSANLQNSLLTLVQNVLLPLLVFFIIWKMPMNKSALRMLFVIILSTGLTLVAAWYVLKFLRLPGHISGALLFAAVFGNVVYFGIPVTGKLVAGWTTRVAIEFMIIANVLIMFAVSRFLMPRLANSNQGAISNKEIVTEPLLWASIIGLLVNIIGLKMPGYLASIQGTLVSGLTPILMITLGLGLRWKPEWNKLIVRGLLPVAGLKLLLLPLLVFLLVKLFGPVGAKTFKALMINAAAPSFLIGIIMVERHGFSRSAYTAALTFTTVLALVLTPVWLRIL